MIIYVLVAEWVDIEESNARRVVSTHTSEQGCREARDALNQAQDAAVEISKELNAGLAYIRSMHEAGTRRSAVANEELRARINARVLRDLAPVIEQYDPRHQLGLLALGLERQIWILSMEQHELRD